MSHISLSNHQSNSSESKPPARKKSQASGRLQHYPSLPNIWIPPHSTPMSEKFSEESSKIAATPSAPSSPKISSRQLDSGEKVEVSSAKGHVKYASTEVALRKTVTRTHARRRTERDQPHNLLTPPLTPSSSIRTTASADVPVKDDVDTTCTEIVPADPYSTRHLLIENVNRQITVKQFQISLFNAIKAHHQHALFYALHQKDMNEVVSAANNRRLSSDGVILIVFYDTRVAKIAEEVLLQPGATELEKWVQPVAGDEVAQFRCRFLSVEAAEEMFGPSQTLDKVDATFLLSVEFPQVGHEDTPLTNQDSQCDQDTTALNVPRLLTRLKSVGDVRSFTRCRKDTEKNHIIFNVEYFNVADSIKAWLELHGKVFAGMALAFLKAKFVDATLEECRVDNSVDSALPEKRADQIILGPPGLASDIRRRFEHRRPEEGESIVTHLPSHLIGPESPQFFYNTSPCCIEPGTGPYEYNDPFVMPSYSHFPPLSTAGPSPMYYPGQAPTGSYLPHNYQRAATESHPFPIGFPQSFMLDGIMVPHPSMGAWPCDHNASAMPNGSSVPIPGMVGPSHFYPTDYIPATGPPYHIPFPYQMQRENVMDAGSLIAQPTPDQFASPLSFASPHIPSPPSSSKFRSTGLISSGHGQKGTEGNQLNLAKIEAGGDTRTTVMIKNIPNKMTDKDLEEYIAQICPRQIDFLYLRIDFTSGCNVGYAFVNFITIKALRAFAEARLGVKWNMFSSEKVLQMTYANYQGKEACIEKFKNSCIMDEKEEWRPRIYYTSGANQGLPEPFPPPSHFRRKERSSQNRGALYVPGVNSSGASYGGAGGDIFGGPVMIQHRRGPWSSQNRRRDGMGRNNTRER